MSLILIINIVVLGFCLCIKVILSLNEMFPDVDVEGWVDSDDTHELQIHERVEVRHHLSGGVTLLPGVSLQN